MYLLIAIIVLILVGAYFLMRSGPSEAPAKAEVGAPDVAELRGLVLAKLRDRLAGWDFEAPEDEPAMLVAIESGTERRLRMDLTQLAAGWQSARERGATQEADAVIEDFIRAATGEGEAGEAHAGAEWARGALALKLVEPAKKPGAALSRPAGPLAAILVVRSPAGGDVATAEDLREWGLDEEEAFRTAFENLSGDVAEGLRMDAVDGTEDAPKAVAVAPGDPLAASYLLAPGLAASLRRRFDGRDAKVLLVNASTLVAYPADASAPELRAGTEPLVKEPVEAGAFAWAKVP